MGRLAKQNSYFYDTPQEAVWVSKKIFEEHTHDILWVPTTPCKVLTTEGYDRIIALAAEYRAVLSPDKPHGAVAVPAVRIFDQPMKMRMAKKKLLNRKKA